MNCNNHANHSLLFPTRRTFAPVTELKSHAIQGAKWSSVAAAATALGGVAQLLILARILDRSDFGLMAIAQVALNLCIQLSDMGLGSAIVRKKTVTLLQLSSIFWLNLGVAALLSVVLALLAPLLARFYAEPELERMLWLLIPGFWASGATGVFLSLLQRGLFFKKIAFAETVSNLLGLTLSVMLALVGYGVYALIWGVLCRLGLLLLLCAFFARRLFRPAWVFSRVGISAMWRVGAGVTADRMLTYVNLNTDTLLIGKVLGSDALGVYDVARRLLIQPLFVINPLINKISFPIMAQVQDDPLRLRRFALRAIQWVAAVNAPIYMAALTGASLLVPVLFGVGWDTTVEPFRWLAVCFFFRTLLNPMGAVVFAKGRLERSVAFQALSLPVFALCVYVGLYGGLTAMIQVLAIYYALQLAGYLMWVVRPHAPLDLRRLLEHTGLEALCALVSFGAAYVLAVYWTSEHVIVQAATFLALGLGLYAACMYVVRPHMRDEFFQMLRKTPRV